MHLFLDVFVFVVVVFILISLFQFFTDPARANECRTGNVTEIKACFLFKLFHLFTYYFGSFGRFGRFVSLVSSRCFGF